MTLRIKSITLLFLILLVCFLATACSGTDSEGAESPPAVENRPCLAPGDDFVAGVEVTDAWCTAGDESAFVFRFSLNNLKNEPVEVTCTWTLNEPMSDQPFYEGSAEASLPASGKETIELPIAVTRLYDTRFYVMYVCVFQDGVQTGYYREQKSTYDWDYRTEPPVRRESQPVYRHIYTDTLVERMPDGTYKVTLNDLFFLPPGRTAPLPLEDISVSFDNDSFPAPLTAVNGVKPAYDLAFSDTDGNGELSAGDYLTVSGEAKNRSIRFEYRNEPSIHFYSDEVIETEQAGAIRIGTVEYRHVSDSTVQVKFEVTSESPSPRVNLRIIHPGEGGYGETGADSGTPVTEGNTGTWETVIDYSRHKERSDDTPLYLLIFAGDGTNEVLHYVCELP